MMVSSTDTGLTKDGCPPLEDLAAFLDGKLPEDGRARVTAHLADCERCYEVFAGAARFQEDSVPRGGVLPFPFGRAKAAFKDKAPSPWKATALAASALLVVGLGAFFGYQAFMAQPEMAVADLIEPLQDQEAARNLYRYDVFRGPGDKGGVYSDRPSFMVGVFLVDLRLALEVGDVESSANLLQAISNELKEVLLIEEEEADRYSDLYLQLKDGAKSAEVLRQLQAEAPTMEAKLSADDSGLSPEFLAFGKWTEAARLAAVTGTPDFFEKWANRRFLARVIEEKKAQEKRDANKPQDQDTSEDSLSSELESDLEWEMEGEREREEEVLNLLNKVRDLWNDDDLDYTALAGTLDQIIDLYDRSSA